MNEQLLNTGPVAVIGGGTMGTALAQLLCGNGMKVRMWVYEKELVSQINDERRNGLFLPDTRLHESIEATDSFAHALSEARLVFSVTPSQVIRHIWESARTHLRDDAVIVCASKGIETGTGKLISEVLPDVIGSHAEQRIAYLSGPSFAKEMLAEQPTAVVIASRNAALAQQVQHLISNSYFRAYTTDDVIGVEMGGAIKNVIAIAVGIAEGLGLGSNSRSALITRGLAEITRLAVTCGGQPLTLSGLAGMGDLVLTCTGHLSRNLQTGIRLGRGESLQSIQAGTRMVAEGVATAYSTLQLAASRGVEMPITEVVVSLLEHRCTPEDAVATLMGRRLRAEREH